MLRSTLEQFKVEDSTRKILNDISRWDSGGQDSLREFMLDKLKASPDDTLASIPLSHAIATLLKSRLNPQSLVSLFSTLILGFPQDEGEQQMDMLGEAFIDVIEVLEEENEDREENLNNGSSEMVVDAEEKKWKGGQKGLEVLKALLVRKLPYRTAEWCNIAEQDGI